MPPAAVQNDDESVQKPHLIFVYGTLKRGFPNHYLLEDLISSNDAVPLMTSSNSPTTYFSYRTADPYPLIRGPLGIPYLLNIPGSGRHVRGELYSVSAVGLIRLDELEGTRYGHYERLPIKVVKMMVVEKKDHNRDGEMKHEEECGHNQEREECNQTGEEKKQEETNREKNMVENVIEAEAYYANRTYAEDMWRRSGMVGLEEYTVADADMYVRPENRPAGGSLVDRIRAYVASSD